MKQSLICLLSPLEVVRSWPNSSEVFDYGLDSGPEPELLERVVEPAGRDAEVGLVGRDVVHAVVLTREDEVAALQRANPEGKPEIRVRPLVDLVGERDKEGQEEEVAVVGVRVADLVRRAGEDDVRLGQEGDQGHHAVVAVGLDDIVPCDRRGVNVVFPERSDKCL